MRKTKEVSITEEGRDRGKRYLLTEFPCSKAERWALRALRALIAGGAEGIDPRQGMAVFTAQALYALGNMDEATALQLLDEMFECVQFIPSQNVVRGLIEDDIEEIATRLFLRAEILSLHTDFFKAGKASTSTLTSPATSQNTKTSPTPSAQPSPAAR